MSQKEELQQKMLEYHILEERFKQFNERRELFAMKLMEIEQTGEALEELKKSKQEEILVPLGSSVFMHGNINKKEKFIISIGSDVAVEKNSDETKKILEERKKTLENGIETVQSSMVQIANQIQKLEPEIQKLLQKQG